jgi:hypothetical protein
VTEFGLLAAQLALGSDDTAIPSPVRVYVLSSIAGSLPQLRRSDEEHQLREFVD